MLIYTANPAVRAAVERAHAERSRVFHDLFSGLFGQKERPAPAIAQTA